MENLANTYLIKPTKLCFYILGYIRTYLHRATGLIFFAFFFFFFFKTKAKFSISKVHLQI